MPARQRPAGALIATLLLVAGCGGGEPAPLEAMASEVPADLCAAVPASARSGLQASASSDATGNPTAACSLRSPDGSAEQAQAVITWVQSGDEISAYDVLDSQCRAIDPSAFRLLRGFSADGSAKSCAASGKAGSVSSATLAAVSGLEVVTVRLSAEGGGEKAVLARGQQMLEGVLASLTGK